MANLDVDWRRKILTAKFTVYPLNEAGDFENWHAALRKVVGDYEMGAALLFSIPQDEKDRYIPREDNVPQDVFAADRRDDDDDPMPGLVDMDDNEIQAENSEAEASEANKEAVRKLPEGEAAIYAKLMSMLAQSKKQGEPKAKPKAIPVAIKKEPKPTKPYFIDLTLDDTRPATSVKQKDLMRRMGVSSYLNEFFSPSTAFISGADGKVEKEPQTFYRHEIWNWMEQSLQNGVQRLCYRCSTFAASTAACAASPTKLHIYLFRARIRKDIYPAAEG